MKTIRIDAQRPYDVMIGYGLLPALGGEIKRLHAPCRVALVSDENVYALYGQTATRSLAEAGYTVLPCLISPGEASKSSATLMGLLDRMAENSVTRSDLIVALGGGVTGDLAGFAASIYLRGIDYVQVPTTLLAAVDSAVGGKTGINLATGKNLVGAFWHPLLVLFDCDTLTTLPKETFLDGVAESLKYGVICDRSLFEQIAQGVLDGDCLDTVARCVQIKGALVTLDERDQDRRQLLNFGHTFGQALEAVSGYTVSHGQAVAMGMVAEARIAEALGVCVMGSAGIVMAMHDRLGLPSETAYDARALAAAALADKKRHGDTLTLVLPESIGKCVLYPVSVQDVPRLFRLAKGERA